MDEGPNPGGLCLCGCGDPAPIARQSDTRFGYVKGRPMRYIRGHVGKAYARPVEEPNPSGLCMCGCGQQAPLAAKTSAERGYVKGKPLRYINGHAMRYDGGYVVDAETGCWNWGAATFSNGYGVMSRDGHATAHRWMYEREVGPIPEGMHVHHRCENKRCVNPEHLELMTPEEHGRLHRLAQAV